MARLPPRYVNSPVEIIYHPSLSPGALRTFLRIYGLHWDKSNPPRMNWRDWCETISVSKTTFYKHLEELGSSGWLQSKSDSRGVLSFEFRQTDSQTPERTPARGNASVNLNNPEESNPHKFNNHRNAGAQNPGKRRGSRDPLLDQLAVKAYRAVMHLTPNHVQRRMIAATVDDPALWVEVLEHWAGHGWRPTNLTGIIDSYRRGGRLGCRLCKAAGEERDTQVENIPPEDLRKMIAQAREEKGDPHG